MVVNNGWKKHSPIFWDPCLSDVARVKPEPKDKKAAAEEEYLYNADLRPTIQPLYVPEENRDRQRDVVQVLLNWVDGPADQDVPDDQGSENRGQCKPIHGG